ncbi:MAG TPA: GNVR domain-containing protein, partial [bacterium]|nr:GNVR domain-containing protein [bacterium]
MQKKINTDEIFGTGQVIGGTLSNYFSSQRTLQTTKDTIMSKSVALRVINQLGLVERNASMSEIDMIISKLLQRIEVSIDEKEGKIFITITSSEPKKATRIVNAFAEAFRVESEKQARYSEQVLVEYLKEQVDIARERREQAYSDLLSFKQQYNVELTRSNLLNQSTLEAMEQKLEETVKLRMELEKELGLIQQKRRGRSVDITQIKAFSADAELNAIETERNRTLKEIEEMNAKFMHGHPKLLVLNENLIKLTEKYEVVLDKKISNIMTAIEQQLNDYYNAENKLKRDIEIYRIKIANLPKVELESKKLERAYVVTDELYTMLNKKLEEAKLRAASEVSDVREVIEAQVPTKPFYPNERQSALAGLVIGLILGFAFAFIVESMDTSIGTIEDVEKYV